MLKVLMVGSSSSVKGGITSVISQLLNYDWEQKNIAMRFIPTYKDTNKLVQFLHGYIKIIIAMVFYKPDVIHIHMSYKGSFYRKYYIHRLCKYFRKRTIIHLHGSEFEKFYNEANSYTKKRVNKLLKESDLIMVLGKSWEESIKKIEPKSKTVIMRNTVKEKSTTVSFDNKINIIFMGVLIKRKGVSDLLDVMKELQNENFLSKYNITLHIGGSGTEEKSLKKKCIDLNLSSHVKFLGWVNEQDKENLFKKNQLFILPSYNEGLPIAILEAMSYGLPVISTTVGSIDEAVIDGTNGFLVEPGNIEQIKEAIIKICGSKEDWEYFSKMSKQLSLEKFDEDRYFNDLASIYKKIIR